MRVALVSDMYLPRRGGIELHLADLAARLRDAGHAVDVLTPTPGPADLGVRRLALPLLPGTGVTIDPRLFGALGRALDVGRYDVAHCHASVFSPAAWAAMWAARRRGVPAVLTFHSVLRTSARWLGAAYRALGAGRWPLAVTGVSEIVARQARRVAPGAPVGVLPNAVDVAWWRAGAAADGRAGVMRLACAMRLTRKKRPAALLRVVAAVRRALPDARLRLTLAGEGSARPAVERLVARLGLGDVVRLPGWLSRPALRELYHASDAFVLPTVDESFGIAALEARAAGLPVLARRGTGVVDFVRDGAHGYLVASDDEMAERLITLGRDPLRLAALAARSRAEPVVAYDWSAVVAWHEAVYASVTDRGAAERVTPRRAAAR